MIGVVVPAHNEEDYLLACIRSLQLAARHPALGEERVRILVVLDDCTDSSATIAKLAGAEYLAIRSRNVGAARAAGAEWLLARGARWLAFTDADSEVGAGWLTAQIGLNADMVCGTVEIADWDGLSVKVRETFESSYCDHDEHRHIHGANLGISAWAYQLSGGFKSQTAHEDVCLVQASLAAGHNIAWSARPRVKTSARLQARAPEGFATYLNGLLLRTLCTTPAEG